MKVIVVYDEKGRIISVTRHADASTQPSGIVKLGVIPGSGQHAHEIKLPPELEKEPLLNLHSEFRVEVKSKRPFLVRGAYLTEQTEKKK